jgi:hypothetical protein
MHHEVIWYPVAFPCVIGSILCQMAHVALKKVAYAKLQH